MTEREPHVPDDRDAHSYGRLYGVYSRLHDWFGRENRAFVSQDGTEVSGFDLQLRGDSGRFGFTRIVADAPAMAPVATASSIVPQPGEWYHLAGVYNSVKQTISLYVNGKHQQTVPFTQPWPARGSLAVGRGRFNGNAVDYVSGRIDDARTYVGALSASEISRLAGRARFQSTHPKPDRRSTRPSSGRSSRRSTIPATAGCTGS